MATRKYKGFTPAQQRANEKYHEKQDSFSLRCSKETGQYIRNAAARAGQSVNQFILNAVLAKLESEQDI